eukprot:TRINITY_DN10007_c0_g1_i6.p1 TRINITY_DN10007_c0_g1~~TRINITY_DN10007_c0_g1_i6.p1  ORF type:complete len:443 (+),score=71.01 TRINITY_DN10007_c0_g1_i6:318-1646(+)
MPRALRCCWVAAGTKRCTGSPSSWKLRRNRRIRCSRSFKHAWTTSKISCGRSRQTVAAPGSRWVLGSLRTTGTSAITSRCPPGIEYYLDSPYESYIRTETNVPTIRTVLKIEIPHCTQLVGNLGKGGFGQVFLARRKEGYAEPNEPEYAVKKVALSNEDQRDELRQEELALSMCNHENIVKLICAFHSQDEVSLVLECARGVELRKLVAESPMHQFGEERTRLILEQVAGAVRHVHGMGIIHRDINPKNVLMVQEPRGQPEWNERAVLLDFGQSIVLPEAGVHLSVCYQSGGGFLGYRAPEIVLQGFEHSYPVDLFSIGCLLHLMLTGQPPFLSEYAEKEQTRVAFNSPDCSEEAKSLLESLLQPDQHTRATVGDLVQSEWLSSGDDWEMVESAVRNTAHETVAAYEWETKVFGDWNWGTLTKNHWEVDLSLIHISEPTRPY